MLNTVVFHLVSLIMAESRVMTCQNIEFRNLEGSVMSGTNKFDRNKEKK